ncbi:Hypothetical protein P9215_12641 [Prochlorococcus marinus str. MIT 9215]|uniref:Uncharacterized protein n=1 Tax=Prochlorococcus marinus (strain MIT 9215) TaxID=93060 RepID=A8G5J8_PROM2|nr:Hypothetical protein P9215_12641 [Prochlorococcus marinus str. MIT 9215]
MFQLKFPQKDNFKFKSSSKMIPVTTKELFLATKHLYSCDKIVTKLISYLKNDFL